MTYKHENAICIVFLGAGNLFIVFIDFFCIHWPYFFGFFAVYKQIVRQS